ncbi:Major facilitator superfamily [Lasiodiplodia theobromae]|nr:Major facilitator superfamily [Lasiodiplodia theobromae]
MAAEKDVESGRIARISHFKRVFDQAAINDDIINAHYEGAGTEEDPYIVAWLDDDPVNPMNYPIVVKWTITALVAIATLAVAFVSSAYSGGIREIIVEFGVVQIIATLGVSLFVLGFAIGPLIWAPMSELFGRQFLFFGTYMLLTAFNAGAAGANSIGTLIVLRFLAGSFGSSPLTNAGGVIADMFPAAQRGLATSLFATAPFLGPVIGPIVGGFVGQTVGWRWVEGVMAIFTGVLWLYGPAIRARCKYAAQAAAFLEKLRGQAAEQSPDEDSVSDAETQKEDETVSSPSTSHHQHEQREPVDESLEDDDHKEDEGRFAAIKTQPNQLHKTHTNASTRTARSVTYEANPFDIDRVNTHESFAGHKTRSRANSVARK